MGLNYNHLFDSAFFNAGFGFNFWIMVNKEKYSSGKGNF